MQFSLDQQLQSRHKSLLEQFSRDYLGLAFHISEENRDHSFLGSKFPSIGTIRKDISSTTRDPCQYPQCLLRFRMDCKAG